MSLSARAINQSYGDLLVIENFNLGLDEHVRYIEDGGGTTGPLGLSEDTIGIAGHIIPSQNSQFDIGSAERKVRHLYLSNNSLYIGEDESGNPIQISRDDAVRIKGLGAGTYVTTQAMEGAMATKLEASDIANLATVDDVEAIIGAAPDALNTLAEISSALGDDSNYAATISGQLAGKANVDDLNNHPTVEQFDAALANKADTASVPTFSFTSGVLHITTP